MKHHSLLHVPDELHIPCTLARRLTGGVCLVLLFLVLLLSSCSLPGLTGPTSPAHKGASLEQPMIVLFQPFTLVQACLDITSSYPYADFKKAEAKIADATDQAVVPNSAGLSVYVNLISSNSWTDDSTIFTEHVPAIPADPAPLMAIKAPAPTGNVFTDQQAKKKAAKQNADALAAYQSHLKSIHAGLKRLQGQVHQDTNKLRGYNVAQTSQGTDIYGCLDRAAARMVGVTGSKLLLVASDLQNNLLTQDTGSLNLSGVRVVVFYHYCRDVATCQSVNGWFSNLVRGAGASSVSFYDVAQSDMLSDVFSA